MQSTHNTVAGCQKRQMSVTLATLTKHTHTQRERERERERERDNEHKLAICMTMHADTGILKMYMNIVLTVDFLNFVLISVWFISCFLYYIYTSLFAAKSHIMIQINNKLKSKISNKHKYN